MLRSFAFAGLLALCGCVVRPVAVYEPAPVMVEPMVVACNDSIPYPQQGECFSPGLGLWQPEFMAFNPLYPQPVGFVSFGFGGSHTVINNTTVINHVGFAAAHPGVMAGLRAAAKGAKVTGKVAVVAAKAKRH
jgi:hypothetical protein